MHEASIMMSILETVVQTAEKERAKAVTRIVLKIGEKSGVIEDALRFAFDAACRGTVAENAALEIDMIALWGECLVCGHCFRARDALICDRCENFAKVISGQELTIESIEVA